MSADRRNTGGKVAVGALGAAKRDRDVNAERVHPPPPTAFLSILTSSFRDRIQRIHVK
jgi:hypothetical protein